ncbi:MAG: hypothetical protein ACE5D8_06455 [Fidelibacterota bacterium]
MQPVILDAGDLLFTTPRLTDANREVELLTAKKIIQGQSRIGSDGVNVGTFEFAAGFDFLKSITDTTRIPFISANLRYKDTGEYAFIPFRIIERDGLKIGITGVTSQLPATIGELAMEPYLTAGKDMIQELQGKADIVVVMVNAKSNEYQQATDTFSGADYLFFSGSLQQTRPTDKQLANGPLGYKCGKQGKFLTEIHLTIANIDSPIVDVSGAAARLKMTSTRLDGLQKRNPEKSLEEIFADNKTMLKLVKDYRQQRAEAQAILDRAVNRSEFKRVAMNRKIGDDPEMLEFVNTALAEIKALKPNTRNKLKGARRNNPVKPIKQ